MPHESTATPTADRAPHIEPPPTPAPRVVTPSALSLFHDCPRRYAFRYVERVPAEFHPVAFSFGRALHAAVEAGVGPPLRESPALDAAKSRFLQVFRQECAENPVRFEEGDSQERAEVLGLHLVEVFFAHVPFHEIAAAEVSFEVPLSHLVRRPEPIVLRGRFDLRLAGGEVGEIKTTKRPLLLPVLRRSMQLRAYVLAALLLEGRAPSVRLIQLLKSEDASSCSIIDLSFAPEELSDFIETVRRMLQVIDRRRFFRNVGARCWYCEYEDRCLGRGPTQ